MLRHALLLFPLFISQAAYAQEMSAGDSSIVNSIRKKTSFIYEHKDTAVFFLTSRALQKIKSNGTSMVVYLNNDSVNRIVTTATSNEGVLSAEYYLENERLIFTFITFEYFDEARTTTTRKNFKGIKSWESRYYFDNEQIKYQKHLGIKEEAALYPYAKVLNDKTIILNYIKTKMKKL